MADGFIVRKGGAVTEQALAPTITEVSNTDTEIVFTITNNDASTAVILWEVDDSSPDANSLELATGVTSSNITVDSLADDTTFIVYATANVTGKIKSEIASESITTDETIVYTAATGGTTEEYDSGGKRYKSHTFTSDGTFTVTTVGDAIDDRNKVDYLIIAGGGAGSAGYAGAKGGGGGAGGYRTTNGTSGADSSAESKVVVTAQGYTIDVGAGASASGDSIVGLSGENSSALGVTSTGGGGGGNNTNYNAAAGQTGGSGGGGYGGTSGTGAGGAGTAFEGFAGGASAPGAGGGVGGGGGGGAGSVGSAGVTTTGGNGGDGLANLLRTGSNETRASGGKGGQVSVASVAGTANTGEGSSGGPGDDTSSAGGSGIVVIRYEIAPSV
jgi:hypothetical protein